MPRHLSSVSRTYLSNAYKALNVPKSDLQITQGLKSRDKVLSLGGSLLKDDKEECISRILALLNKASDDA